jgi:hypothetical protein
MKSIVMPEPESLKEGKATTSGTREFSEVKETVASMVEKNLPAAKRKFTVSDMWNRHRQRRSASAMIRKWNLN